MNQHGFALIPKKEQIEDLIACQKEILKEFPNLVPILETKTNIPHITLIQGSFKEDLNYQEIAQELRKNIISLELKVDNIMIKDDVWLFLMIKANKELKALHLESFNKTKEFLIAGNKEKNISHFSKEEKGYFLKYGYRYIDECFIPHITLGKSKDPLKDEEKQVIRRIVYNFLQKKQMRNIEIERLCFHKLGEAGSCKEEVF